MGFPIPWGCSCQSQASRADTHCISIALSLILRGILKRERSSVSHSDQILYQYSASLLHFPLCSKSTGDHISRLLTLEFRLSTDDSISERSFSLIGEWFAFRRKESGSFQGTCLLFVNLRIIDNVMCQENIPCWTDVLLSLRPNKCWMHGRH